MVQLYQDGGAFMHPLLILMLIGIALGLFKLFQLYRVRQSSHPLINKIAADLGQQAFPPVIERCASTPGPVASVIRSGLLSRQKGINTMRSIMSAVGDIEYAFLERGLSWLNFIIVIAPLLGFTGTVWGMIVAFQEIKVEQEISPAIVAGGISQALLTTLFGLIVAMIVHFFHNICSTNLDNIMSDMEQASVTVLENCG